MRRTVTSAVAVLVVLFGVAPQAARAQTPDPPAGGVSGPTPPLIEILAGTVDANTSIGIDGPPGTPFSPPPGPPTAVFQVTYTGFTPAAQAAFQRAVDIWSNLVTSSIPIKITAEFKPLGDGVLGSASPSSIWGDFTNAVPSTWYPVALANALSHSDVDPGQPDINANFNSSQADWYYGTDGQTPSSQYDFVSVVLHEIGHGLGFSGSMRVTGSSGSWGFESAGGPVFPMIYDRFTQDLGSTALLNTTTYPNPSTALGNALKSGNVYFNGPKANISDAQRSELYAPSPWQGGSSYSHLDESLYPAGTINSLMTPNIDSAEANHTPGPIALCIFEDMGWVTPETCAPPANDAFASAQVISGQSGTVTGTNVGATKQAGEPNHASNNVGGPSIWYSWTAPATAIFTFDTSGSSTGTYQVDTMLGVYTGSAVNSLTLVTNNEDENTGAGVITSVAGPLQLNAGVTYRIAVDGFREVGHPPATGPTRLNWSTGPIERASVDGPAHQASGASTRPDISSDGRYVAFTSTANDLVPGDTKFLEEVFVRDRLNRTTTRIDVDPAGNQALPSFSFADDAVITPDGRYVAFRSDATNLVAGDTNDITDVFLRDLQTSTTSRVNIGDAEQQPDGASFSTPALSADGRYVAFDSYANNLVAGDTNFFEDVYVRDRVAGTTVRVSVDSAEAESNGTSFNPAISADGRYVAFQSDATNLVTPDGTNSVKILVRDLVAGTTTLVSQNDPTTVEGSFPGAFVPDISADGRYVTFSSDAVGLVAGDGNGAALDVFVFDRQAGTTARVSRSSGGAGGNAESDDPAISADGQLVAFSSDATNLVAGDANAVRDVFIHDRATGTTTRASLDRADGEASGPSGPVGQRPGISANLGFVAFTSSADDLVPADSNFADDVFVRQLAPLPPVGGADTDFDGDGDTDRSVFRAGAWFAQGQATGFLGQSGDIPVPADYDGSGDSDRAVYRSGAWFVDGQATVFLGAAGDIPVPADYDGDGDADRAVFRPSVGGWFVEGQATAFFGLSTDIPVPGDYDGDGDVDRAVYRPSVGGWYVQGQTTVFLGLNGDIPVPGDYDGNGTLDRGIWRKSVGGWYVQSQTTVFLGLNGDVPVPGDYDGNGTVDRGIWRPPVGGWYVQGQTTAFLGLNGDIPLPLHHAVYRAFF
jgi:hypothetical protein